jgi:hypothetical protein
MGTPCATCASPTAARPARAIAAARGVGRSWVAFLDLDDLWEPEALATLHAAAQADPAVGVVAMKARAIRADGTRTGRIHGKKSPGPRFTTRSLLWGDSGGVLMPMVRRDLLLAAGGFDESLSSATDCAMWLRLSFRTELIGGDRPLLLVRVHPDNVSGDKSLNARMWLRLLDKLKREQPAWVRENAWTYRRALGKERLRFGRESTAGRLGEGTGRRAGRVARERRRLSVLLARLAHLAWSLLAPGRYAAWRRLEMRHR